MSQPPADLLALPSLSEEDTGSAPSVVLPVMATPTLALAFAAGVGLGYAAGSIRPAND